MMVRAEEGHIKYLAAHMRQADREEVMAACGKTPARALEDSLTASRLAWTFTLLNGRPVFMAGVAAGPVKGLGHPWMLGTDEVERAAGPLVVKGPAYVRMAGRGFRELCNIVAARNEKAIRWLAHCGFTVEPGRYVTLGGLDFRYFHMEVKNV